MNVMCWHCAWLIVDAQKITIIVNIFIVIVTTQIVMSTYSNELLATSNLLQRLRACVPE